MTLRLTFKLEVHSDYHVGAGHGRGTEVDSALLRDADGVPVIRGTVLNGLLRDGLWRLLQLYPLHKYQGCPASGQATDEGAEDYCGQYASPDHDPELCPVCRLFGTPRHPKRWRISSARPSAYPDLVSLDDLPEGISGQRVMRVRVNPRTRRAAARQLFSEEQGRCRTFIFTATCFVDGEDTLDDAALLVAAARFVRELGRSRRRGQGECLISLTHISGMETDLVGHNPQNILLSRFESHWLKGKPTPLSEAEGETLTESLSHFTFR